MAFSNFIFASCFCGILLLNVEAQSVKGGSRGVKGGSYSSSSRQYQSVGSSSRHSSSSQVQEQPIQRAHYSQSNAARSHGGSYDASYQSLSTCDAPGSPMNGAYSCDIDSSTMKCTANCNPGSKFPDGTDSIEIECSQSTGVWLPYSSFPDCIGSHGGGSSYERSHSSGGSYGQGQSQQRSYGEGGYGHGQSQQVRRNPCKPIRKPMNGGKDCNMSNGLWSCTATCNGAYEFPDGSRQMTATCDDSDGVWSLIDGFPDCIMRRNPCRPIRQPMNGGKECTMSNGVWSCQATCNGAYRFPDGSRQMTATCDDRDGVWSLPDGFPDCIMSRNPCRAIRQPMNGAKECTMANGLWSCEATCVSGYAFPGGSRQMTATCDDSDGVWSLIDGFPDCLRSHGSPGYGHGQSQQGSYSGGAYGQGQSQQVRQNLCGDVETPLNGQKYCTMYNGIWTCQATCDGGYEFPDGTRQMTMTCDESYGVWSLTDGFPDCILLCHPACQNGGTCAVHNQCLCPSTHRGNRCQYDVLLCDFNRLAASSVYSDCIHGPEFTECSISCPPGMTFQPHTTSIYRCTVDGHWNPPTRPQCAMDSLCEKPPSPAIGNVQCNGNDEIMICQGTCPSGYLFPDGFSELVIQCVKRTGEWSPDVGFPSCEPVCNPACQNGGKCLGHNSCLCPREYRGGRCQYPISNCDGHDRFASVAWNCKNEEKETVCNISCGHTNSKLQPPEPTVYICSLDGRWTPDLKPICLTDFSVIDRRTSHERYVVSGESQERGTRQGSHWRESQFEGQQPVDYDFGGQQPMDYDFGGQQEIGHEFGGQQPVRHEFEEQQQVRPEVNYDSDSGMGHSRVGGRLEPYQESPSDFKNYGQQSVDYKSNVQQNNNLEDLDLSRQQQGKEPFEGELVRSSYEDSDEEDQFTMGSRDSKEIRDHGESETEGGNVDLFSHIDQVSPYSGICSAWGYHHYRSFDGGVFTFPSPCPYVLASNCGHENLVISLLTQCDSHGPCERTIGIQLQENRYTLSYERGLMEDDLSLPIPIHIGELTVERIARYLVARLTMGFTIWINEENTVLIVASQFMKNKTCGMCGNYDDILDKKFIRADGSKTDDIYSFGNSWKLDPDGICVDNVEPRSPCSSDTREKSLISNKANLVCESIKNQEFKACSEVIDKEIYYNKCQMDCCSQMAAVDCECASLSEFILECSRIGVIDNNWRKPGLCPMICTNGMEYRQCGPPCPPTCDDQEPTCQQERCVDGCHCPEGTVLENGQCITVDQCPCHHGSKVYESGEKMEQGCNTCVCRGGNWQCTDSICPAICSVSGPHIQTFDGLNYDFGGLCPHYLVDAEDFNIQIDYSNNCRELPTLTSVCIRSITIHTAEGAVVKLKQTMEVSVNGIEMISLPVLAPGVYVGQATSKYIRAELSNGLEVFWDMDASVHVSAPTSLFNELKGLCGTFTKSQPDDFLTPEGDVEQSSKVFAQKWQVEESCRDLPALQDISDQEKPCDRTPARRPYAVRICSVIKEEEFRDCHSLVDYQLYYEECMEDICGCMTEPTACACLALSNYATACARKGRPLSWRQSVPVCGIPCPRGQIYLACANPCSYSCSEIAHSYANCREECIEGCVCPPGQTLDVHGRCVAVSACSCVHSGHVYPPDFMQRRGREMCECSQGQWACHEASSAELILTPPPHIAPDCDASANLEPTDCVSECPVTCSNLLHHQPCTTAVCVPGCRCKKGFIMDTPKGKCVQPAQCPCHHSGKSYEEGEVVTMDCNRCTCESGTWACDVNPCPGLCSAWGDSHYETFDGRLYDFEGSCDYVMVKAHVTESVVFSVVIQNVPCGGGGGATCGKSLSITLGQQTISLTKDHPLPEVPENSRLSVSSIGMFTLVESDVGISVEWDHNTRVYVTAQPIWENKLQGLCGDFNGDSSNDFLPPSGGVPLVLANEFADSWRVHKYCKPASQPEDACDKNPERRTWSKHKCAVLKSELFKPCHYQVEVEEYFKRCVLDSCACNSGGDCECLCAVVSAYAQKCARSGVEIEWRSQELCPVQCESCDRYNPCISLCPPPNCDTYLDDSENSRACARQPCVDGCEPKPCEPGKVHQSATNMTCIPEQFCKEKPCMVIDGVPYREGERIENRDIGDPCQSCYCRLGEVECIGMPCTSISPKPTIGMKLDECEFTGWTDWINSVNPADLNGDDTEDLEDLVSSRRIPCSLANITSIECRVAATQEPAENVVCNLDNGLLCRSNSYNGMCEDHEIRVYCQCHEEVTCPPGQEWNSCAFNCENVCHSMKSYLKEDGACKNIQECVSGCVKKVCDPRTLARDAETCVTPDMCTCRLDSGYDLAPGEVITDGCQKCQCLNNTLICSTTLECKKTVTEITPPYIPEQTHVYETSTVPEVVCSTGWSEWLNLHTPNRQGENELLEDMAQEELINCNLNQITRIQCRDSKTLKTIKYSGHDNVYCDLRSGGLVCKNRDMPNGAKCADFEIRAYCDCEMVPEGRELLLPVTSATRPPTAVIITLPPRVAITEQPVIGIMTTTPSCSYWSDWINKGKPRRGKKHGDKEDTRPYILKQTEGFCLEGYVSAIECREVRSDKDYRETNEEKLVCDVNKGFLCQNKHQPDNRCQDYKIRYFCTCGEVTTESRIRVKPATPAYIYPCSELIPLIDGPEPLPDSQIKASSSESYRSGPNAIKMNSHGSRKAWTAAEMDEKQFIEVDLGDVRAIYGITTKGKEDADEWVTSYKLLYGDDGISYSYYQENDNDKIFSGNYDDNVEVKHVFSQAFEARYVRLEPLTWEDKISLRMDLLGCAEAITTTAEPEILFGTSPSSEEEEEEEVPQVTEMCKEKMGLENGLLLDSQLSASTSHSSRFTPDFARLGSESVWAAAVQDDQQYLQVDFIDPQKVAGIITKGREDVPQWVTAYKVDYSNDGTIWNKVKDDDGNIMEFPANYDAYSTVENLFPNIVRARFVRIRPTKWKNSISMQIEILGCYHPEPCRDPMGLENGVVLDHQLTASSAISEDSSSNEGRLSSSKAWSPEISDNAQFIQVDLLEPTTVSAVITKGNPEMQKWVRSFYVSYGNDTEDMKKVQNLQGRAKEFSGNKDKDSAVINLFPISVTGRYFRIIPREWHRWISLRFELLGCFHEKECLEPMGLENGVLSDAQLTASSAADIDTTTAQVRINGNSGWQPDSLDDNPFIQIDFLEDRNISGVVTKGMADSDNWVKSFIVEFAEDGENFHPVMTDTGETIEFEANKDSDSPVVNIFPETTKARYFRIVPRNFENEIGLRLELLGCYHPYECKEPMGVESGSILDFQISASSYLSDETSPANARLDSDTAWVAAQDDYEPFIQVDFMVPTNLTGLMTRGRNDANEWVKEYMLSYSMDGETYIPVSADKTTPQKFRANHDNESPITNIFPEPINARFLKIRPTDFKRRPGMRFEVIGCHYETKCMEPMGLENGLLSDGHITATSYKSEGSDPTKIRLSSDASWMPENLEGQYIQVDFGDPRNISAIVTKGDPDKRLWVTEYQVAYSEDDDNWMVVEDSKDDPIEFPGNTDNNSPVINVLPEMIQAQHIRLIPTGWENWIALRAEILGCYHPYVEPEMMELTTTTVIPELVLPLTAVPSEPTLVASCPGNMEIETSVLIGAQITASSSTPDSGPSRVLLHTHATESLSGGWVPDVNDRHPVLYIEFPQNTLLTSIYIQGREDKENWVKTFRVVASLDNSTWMPLFGADGDEYMHGNENQLEVVGHFFKEQKLAKYVKIIPEGWHKWPSFRLDLKGCPQPEAVPSESTPEYPELCPELKNYPELAERCPEECPEGQVCDGEECVDPVDCTCVHDGQTFQVSDRMIDSSCKQCDCGLNGHTFCTEKQCEPCEEGKFISLADNCSCECKECGEDEKLCPTSEECIPDVRWCDGIVDCPDDETNCVYTTTITPGPETGIMNRILPLGPTTPVIVLPTPLPVPEKANCDIMGKHIKTFDGQDIDFEVCNHVAMKDIKDEKFIVTIHKECGYVTECKHWIEIYYQNQHIKVQSDLTVEVNGYAYTTGQLWRLSKKTGMSLIASKVGEQVIVKSLRDKFVIVYDVRGHLKIEVPRNLQKRISGLCGYYSGKIEDDQKKPNGRKAFTSREFGKSWTVNGTDDQCNPLICPHEEMKKSMELCNKLKENPFIPCGKMLPLNQFIEFCMSSTCECLLNKHNTENKCKCDSFQPFVEACESKLGPSAVRNWRLIHECHMECPPGMEWNDCGPSCQLTCDSVSADTLQECSGTCVPGCFCPAGTVLSSEMCIPPDQCADQVCQGFGDPHFRTFDGLTFLFQGVGSFLIVGDKESNFEVKGLTKKCGLLTPITCLVGMEINYHQHRIALKKGKEVKVDGKKIPMDKLPLHKDGIVILGYPGRTFVVVIPQINLDARYYEENSGFAVRVPSRKYFNKTKGLCGNCNGREGDELKDESLDDYVCSWQTDGDKEECKKSLEDLPQLKEKKIPMCDKLQDPVFAACHPLVDVNIYVDACNFDAMHSGDIKASFCKTAMEYGRQCCQAGIIVKNWPSELGCDLGCPSGMEYEQCHKGCPQTCISVKNDEGDPSCSQVETDGCFCPEGKVLKNSTCVDVHLCETCDEEGHVPGDTWKVGDCKKCHCSPNLTIECVRETCSAVPVCSEDEILVKREFERETSSCCEIFACIPKKEECPIAKYPKCKPGESAKTHSDDDGCPVLKCECNPVSCPAVEWPSELEEGQEAVIENESCCPTMRIICDHDSCPESPDCGEGLELTSIEGNCCTIYKCKPPKDVCVYTHMYKIVDGIASLMERIEAEITVYQPGERWEDGLCEKCQCEESKGQYVPLCVREHCPTLEDMPENKDYILQEMKIPHKCCPDIFKVKCRDEDGIIYEAGDQWQDEDDPCVTYLCEQDGSDVTKIKSVVNCTECPRTAVLFPPSKILGQCCGVCKITKCEDGEELYEIGETWVSKDDECRMAECISEYGTVKTVYTKQPCPVIPEDCPPDKIIWDEKGCCKVCNLTSELGCSSGPIPEEDTIGFFTYNELSEGGICVNERPVKHVLQCKGACHSSSYYSLEDGDFKDNCKCCKVNITVNRTIELRCPSGNYITKTFLQPESCQCSKCAPKSGISKKNDFNPQPWVQQRQWDTDSDFEFVQKPADVGRFTDQNEQRPYNPQENWQFQQNQVQQQEDYDI